MLSSFSVFIWASAAFATCDVQSTVEYRPVENRRDSYSPQRLETRTTSLFASHNQQPSFPYRFVFPANHPANHAVNQPNNHPTFSVPTFSQYVNTPHSSFNIHSELGYSGEIFAHHQSENNKNKQILPDFELVSAKPQQLNEGFTKHVTHQQQQPHSIRLIKQNKLPNIGSSIIAAHQSYPFVPNGYQHVDSPTSSLNQPIMLLLSSGHPDIPYQSLLLVPTPGPVPPLPTAFPSYPQFQQSTFHTQSQLPPQLTGGFVPNSRGIPLMVTSYSGFQSLPPSKYSNAQLFHRSHEPPQQQDSHHHQQQLYHLQQRNKNVQLHEKEQLYQEQQHQNNEVYPNTVIHDGISPQHLFEDKVGAHTGISNESSSVEVGEEGKKSLEIKVEPQEVALDFGEKTSSKLMKRIIVA
ncbi:centrosome-associated protein ALMS1-like [Daktulosphaira vitifoliae]|uniref:centrosome-associated protein ALMS1-like n=1 Tax=Daktulosphaira vitifoliae TaxID=58002 RepID=UPI0021AA3B5C|nr:centrosome-associated protein ALMS1-like [Daktulosphaira vitifoliae]